VEALADPRRPGPGQVLVDVEAAGVNYLDVIQRKGISKLPLPFTPGLEGVVRVRDVGELIGGATGKLAVGQRVAWINVPGSYANQVVIPSDRAIRVPDSFSAPKALLFRQ
jgi:NADPH2:quinone reductase